MEVVRSIGKFSTISLNEMNEVSLMKRIDTKFLIPIGQLHKILNSVVDHYKVLEINGNRTMTYRSLYFDTACGKFYKDHHNGRSKRTKVRIRNYVESELFFLEIKQKDNKGVTAKTRIKIDDFEINLSEHSKQFIYDTVSNNYDLAPSLWNGFKRVTLVDAVNKERITIDFDLNYTFGNNKKKFDSLAIVEMKQERYNRNSPIVAQLKSIQSHPYSISKYCIGLMSLCNNLKYNRFKKNILKIEKLANA
ncbi:MAG: polyphosphate polymerase domain-containing protein [Reichenbachiella sp.]|uniref:polyphosphate polymerase domain-containing protein n=1 Tax=Reichenbachiella sp. TaxID=2184521 RepID=UPI003297C673